jgi:hypothetical protein
VGPETGWIAVGAWLAIVLVHGLGRFRSEAESDPIRPSGPLDQL